MKKTELLLALQTEIAKHNLSTFMNEADKVVEVGCSHCKKRFGTNAQFVRHITDDVLLLAKAALNEAGIPPSKIAKKVNGFVLSDCCRAFEFRIRETDSSRERVHLTAEVIHTHRIRDFFGFNRAKHAVLEAAILATRFHLLPKEEIDREFARLRVIVDKTAGPQEREAMEFLESKWAVRARS